jgi:hypothetical protein
MSRRAPANLGSPTTGSAPSDDGIEPVEMKDLAESLRLLEFCNRRMDIGMAAGQGWVNGPRRSGSPIRAVSIGQAIRPGYGP